MTHEYKIEGMTCGSCVSRVKRELLKIGDVQSANVQLGFPQATISMSKHIGTGTLQKAVTNAGGYTIVEVHGGTQDMKPDVTTINDEKNSYYPIFLIFGYIAGATLLVQAASMRFDAEQWMAHFMAGFFLVFSFFKLLNIKGFAEGYGAYDIVAKKIPAWGFIYPFVELALGLLLLAGVYPLGINMAIFLVMGVSSIGVIQSLLKRSVFQCACLGTIIKLPLSKVTLFEDLLMVGMSAVMIIRSL